MSEYLIANGHKGNGELGKSLNTDEAAAMGAVYKAADLSTGFKVTLTLHICISLFISLTYKPSDIGQEMDNWLKSSEPAK